MTERGLLMTPVNYGRCKDGSKTQTRRIMEFQPGLDATWYAQLRTSGKDSDLWFPMKGDPKDMDCWEQAEGKVLKCPYGVPGDRLYVKEGLEKFGYGVRYRRDRLPVHDDYIAEKHKWEWQRDTLSPLHMPKWAARLWLELTDVRVERLHEINEADAIAEGCTSDIGNTDPKATYLSTAVAEYRHLWDSIHGHEAWRKNPWLWCLTFNKVRD